jgi:hypothetical protein
MPYAAVTAPLDSAHPCILTSHGCATVLTHHMPSVAVACLTWTHGQQVVQEKAIAISQTSAVVVVAAAAVAAAATFLLTELESIRHLDAQH